MPDNLFADYLKKHSIIYLEALASREQARASSQLVFIGYLIELAKDATVIHPENAQSLLVECDKLQKDLHEITHAHEGVRQTKEPVHISFGIASPVSLFEEQKQQVHKQEASVVTHEVVSVIEKKEEVISQQQESQEEQIQTPEADKRQTAIIEKIAELGNCRLKDLMEHLPDVSERTIRYDLQKLIDQEVVERVGGGGPFSFYRMKPL